MVLSGWKQVATYLGLGVRTVQRWEDKGLPINRPFPGRRSHVVAFSEQLDKWVERLRHGGGTDAVDISINIEKAKRLKRESQLARNEFRSRMQALKHEMEALRTRRRHRQ